MDIAHQTPLSMWFSSQAYWSGLPFPSPGDLPNPRIEHESHALVDGFFTSEPLSSVQFSRSVVSDSLGPHGLQHARLPCPSLTPRACSNSCPLNRWCHPTSSFSLIPFSSCLQSFPASGSFLVSQFLCIRLPKHWSFSFSSSNEYSGLFSFRIYWFDLLAV